MANVPIKTLKDNKGNVFVPFTTTNAVFEDSTGKTVSQLITEQNAKITQVEGEIPTKTSDLNNDSGFIDNTVNDLTNYTKTSDLATVATSGDYDDLTNKPTIPTVNNATLTIQKNSTTIDTFTANASVDKTIDISVPTKVSDLTNDSGFIDKDVNNLTNYTTTTDLALALNNKVDKVTGKGLSTEDYTTTEKTKLSGIATGAEVNTIDTVKVNGTALTPDANKAVDVIIPAAAEYTIAEVTATTGYAKSYQLKKDNTFIGAKIDIPKDLVVSSGEVKTVTTADVPYSGAQVGDKYIDLTLNDPTASHIYIPVNDLVDVYTAGNGIDLSNTNIISTKIDTTNANGLSVGANGVALATATTNAAGAMSAADKTKLDGIETGAEVNIIETVKVNGTALTPDVNKAVDITVSPSQYDIMPTPASAIEGKIVQYVGNTTTVAPIYTNGLFYKCVEDSETPGTYIWENISVIDDYVIAEDVQGQTSISGITILPADNSVTYNMFTSDVKGRFVETFSGTTNPSSSLGKDGDVYFLVD